MCCTLINVAKHKRLPEGRATFAIALCGAQSRWTVKFKATVGVSQVCPRFTVGVLCLSKTARRPKEPALQCSVQKSQGPCNGVILGADVHELLHGDDAVLVSVHFLKDAVDVLSQCPLVRAGASAQERVHRADHVPELLARDEAIAVDVVQRKGPAQFLLHASVAQQRQAVEQVLEADGTVPVPIEAFEDISGV